MLNETILDYFNDNDDSMVLIGTQLLLRSKSNIRPYIKYLYTKSHIMSVTYWKVVNEVNDSGLWDISDNGQRSGNWDEESYRRSTKIRRVKHEPTNTRLFTK